MAYLIKFVGLSTQAERDMIPLTDGYQARVWLPDYDAVAFDSVTAAHEWIAANQVGPDLATVEGLFRVEEDAGISLVRFAINRALDELRLIREGTARVEIHLARALEAVG